MDLWKNTNLLHSIELSVRFRLHAFMNVEHSYLISTYGTINTNTTMSLTAT
jgi:hypothetical protein